MFTESSRLVAAAVIAIGAAAAAHPAAAGQAAADAILSHCQNELNVPEGTCPCLAERALALEDGQQSLLAAIVTGDDATAAQLRTQLPINQVMEVGMFHVNNTPT